MSLCVLVLRRRGKGHCQIGSREPRLDSVSPRHNNILLYGYHDRKMSSGFGISVTSKGQETIQFSGDKGGVLGRKQSHSHWEYAENGGDGKMKPIKVLIISNYAKGSMPPSISSWFKMQFQRWLSSLNRGLSN
jgi:hypothetical protein